MLWPSGYQEVNIRPYAAVAIVGTLICCLTASGASCSGPCLGDRARGREEWGVCVDTTRASEEPLVGVEVWAWGPGLLAADGSHWISGRTDSTGRLCLPVRILTGTVATVVFLPDGRACACEIRGVEGQRCLVACDGGDQLRERPISRVAPATDAPPPTREAPAPAR